MSIHVALTHRTTYRYDRLVSLGPQVIRLRPAPHTRTPILSYALAVAPDPHFLNWLQDPQGNFLARVVFPERVRDFSVTVDLIADMATIDPFNFFLEPDAEAWPFAYDPLLEHELQPYRDRAPPGPLLAALLAATPPGPARTVDMLVALNRRVAERIAYIVRPEPGIWPVEETLGEGRGSCRDSAWVMVQALRGLGFAARFVSGYLIQLVADEKPLDGPPGPAADFTDLHAWAEVYLPGAGWVGLDATSGLLAGEGHIPLAASPDPISAAPITGMVEPCEVAFAHHMEVRRIRETPRVTKPYAEPVWREILAGGERLDRVMDRQGIRLTMGGEPTFVAATDRDAAEWNTTALGPTKRTLCRPHAAPPRTALDARRGPAIHDGQAISGRAAAALGALRALASRRRAGMAPRRAVRRRGRRAAAPPPPTPRVSRRCSPSGCRSIPPSSSRRMRTCTITSGAKERLPANVLAEASQLADPLERARLARVFGQGLGGAVGSVLPLRRVAANGTRRWQSGKWFFRAGAMFLVPGDSPDRLPPAAGEPALGRSRSGWSRRSSPIPSRRARRCRPRNSFAVSAAPAPSPGDRQSGALPPGRPGPRPRSAARSPTSSARRSPIEPRERHDPRLLPAALRRRGLARPRRRGRGHGRGARPQGRAGRLSAAARPAAAALLRHPRSGRASRSTSIRPASWAEQVRAHRGALRGSARRKGWRPKNSCSTAAMSAPAAATMW